MVRGENWRQKYKRRLLDQERAFPMRKRELVEELLPYVRSQSLASLLVVAARADEAAVTAVMGHANIETTLRIYAGDRREAYGRTALVRRETLAQRGAAHACLAINHPRATSTSSAARAAK
jgi:hypothetical protein